MFLNSRGELPGKLLSLFSPNTTMHSYNTRHSEDPHVTNRITSLVSKSFMHVAPQMWYSLSQDIKHAHSTNSFINKIKRKLLG